MGKNTRNRNNLASRIFIPPSSNPATFTCGLPVACGLVVADQLWAHRKKPSRQRPASQQSKKNLESQSVRLPVNKEKAHEFLNNRVGYRYPWVFSTRSGIGMGGFSYPRLGSGSGMGTGLCSWVRVWGVNPRWGIPH
jgi:hypothetical protein